MRKAESTIGPCTGDDEQCRHQADLELCERQLVFNQMRYQDSNALLHAEIERLTKALEDEREQHRCKLEKVLNQKASLLQQFKRICSELLSIRELEWARKRDEKQRKDAPGVPV